MGAYEPYESIRMTEEAGLVRSAERTFVVQVACSGLLPGEVFAAAIADPLVPIAGSALSSSWPNVKCRRRSAELVSSTGTVAIVRITCSYEYEEPNPTYALRGGSSCTQIETNYASPGSTNRITLTYSGVTCTGSITPLVPQGHLTLEAGIATANPDTYVGLYVGRYNLGAWRGGAAKEWLCTSVEYELRDKMRTPPWYHFVFTFERKVGGWVYYCAYKSPDGTIPNDDDAITEVDWHEGSDFSTLFGS